MALEDSHFQIVVQKVSTYCIGISSSLRVLPCLLPPTYPPLQALCTVLSL